MEIYLDNSSTTKVCLPAAEKVMECMTVVYGNPSSLHSMGFAAEKEMTKARAAIAKQIGVKENEIIFTSGGTEANNLAVFGAVEAKKRFGNKIVTTTIEHPSVLGCMEQLEKKGFEVVYLKPDMTGTISPEQVMEAARRCRRHRPAAGLPRRHCRARPCGPHFGRAHSADLFLTKNA